MIRQVPAPSVFHDQAGAGPKWAVEGARPATGRPESPAGRGSRTGVQASFRGKASPTPSWPLPKTHSFKRHNHPLAACT